MLLRLLLPFFIALNLLGESNVSFDAPTELVSKNLYISYDEVPDEIYKNQQFEITLKAIITTPLWDRIDTKFELDENSSFTLYDKSPGWKWAEDNTYYNKYFLKADKRADKLPKITISIYSEDFELLEQADSPEKKIVYKDIIGDEKYSNVIASSLKLISHKTSQFNNMTLMSVIELEGMRSNLEDFYLKEYDDQQAKQSFSDVAETQKLFYKVFLPTYKSKIDFTYYNFVEKRYETIVVPIELEHQLVSTQTDLNPGSSSLLVYKQVAILVAILFFLIIYLIRRKKIFLFFIAIFVGVFAYTFIPNKTAKLKGKSNIYILPTNNSTLFQITKRSMKVEILNTKREYVKILLPNKTIGWVKKHDISKN